MAGFRLLSSFLCLLNTHTWSLSNYPACLQTTLHVWYAWKTCSSLQNVTKSAWRIDSCYSFHKEIMLDDLSYPWDVRLRIKHQHLWNWPYTFLTSSSLCLLNTRTWSLSNYLACLQTTLRVWYAWKTCSSLYNVTKSAWRIDSCYSLCIVF